MEVVIAYLLVPEPRHLTVESSDWVIDNNIKSALKLRM